MRDITFRARRTDNGEWVEGNLVWIKNCNDEPYQCFIISHLAYMEYGEFDDTYQVLPETVGQYTGLTDKNGKKIFEGDIISTDIKRPYLIVEFRDGCFMFNCNDGGEDYYDIMLPICKEPHNKYEYGEVIGNIHDNKELLEVK